VRDVVIAIIAGLLLAVAVCVFWVWFVMTQ